MLIRLLLVVLTVVGPLPFRVCTCAAAPPSAAPAERGHPAPTKSCRCSHESHSKAAVAVAHHAPPAKCSHESPTPAHERDCPTVTSFAQESTCPQADTPTDGAPAHAHCHTAPEPSWPVPPVRPDERAHPPKLPLYLAFLSLRN